MLSVSGLCVPTGFGVQFFRSAGDDVVIFALKAVGLAGVRSVAMIFYPGRSQGCFWVIA